MLSRYAAKIRFAEALTIARSNPGKDKMRPVRRARDTFKHTEIPWVRPREARFPATLRDGGIV